jgi:dihydroorotate dehydrogenase
LVLDLYELAWKPVAAAIRHTDAQVAHDRTVEAMRWADELGPLTALARLAGRHAFPKRPTTVGGVALPHPMILAAGLVKGDGFRDEDDALAAVGQHHNIVPGWRSMPALVGAVEFGSFTREPRLGNEGRTVWRDTDAQAMQNRVGLRNPGVRAAASHLRSEDDRLPATWGVSLALSPGLDDLDASVEQIDEVASYFAGAFAGVGHRPSWYTLNLSCPNTEDDPRGNQTEALARALCAVMVERVNAPVWVKIGPDLSDEQLGVLVRAFSESGVRAVVATNTSAHPAPDGGATAGVSGAPLRRLALRAVERIRTSIEAVGADLDIVASGGILRGSDLLAFQAAGAQAAMLYSALVFRGPLAGALILREAERGDDRG